MSENPDASTLASSPSLPLAEGEPAAAAKSPAGPPKAGLRRRLAIMLALIAGLVLANIASFERLHRRIDANSATLNEQVKLYKLSRRIQMSIEASSPEENRSLTRFRQSSEEFDRDIERYRQLPLSAGFETTENGELPLLIEGLEGDWKNFQRAYQALRDADPALNPTELRNALNHDAEELQASVIAITFTLQGEQSNQLEGLERSIYAIAAADFVVLGLIMFWLRRRVVEPVERITGAARRLANADFSARVAFDAENNNRDEIGDLGRLFNVAADRIQRLMSDIARESASLREAEAKFRSLAEQSLVGIYLIQNDQYVYVNPRFAQTFAYPVEQLLQLKSMLTLIHPDDRALVEEQLRRRLDGEVTSIHYEFRGVRADGSIVPVEVLGTAATYRGQPAVIGTLIDLSERKQTEAELQRIHRTLQVLSACNQSLVHTTSVQELADAICQNLVKLGGFPLACISFADDAAARSVQLVACAGPAADYARYWSNEERGSGNSGEAIRRGEVIVARNIASDPGYTRWRSEAIRHQLASSVSLPLSHNGEILGVLRIYSSETDAFTAEELKLLNELADDLAYGLQSFRARQQIDEQATELTIRQRAIESSRSGVMISRCDRAADHPIVYVNAAFEGITGYSRSEVLGRNARILTGEFRDQPEIERLRNALRRGNDIDITLRNARRDGSMFWNELSLSAIRDSQGKLTHFIGTLNDVSERIAYQHELQHHATHDTLTGLANRVLLNDRIEQALAHADRSDRQAGLLLIDLDRFKLINESLGHASGDELLRRVAERLAAVVRKGDTVARIASDQFVVVLAELNDADAMATVIASIAGIFLAPFVLAGQEAFVSASIGASRTADAADNAADAETLLSNAEVALAEAKARGGNNHCFFARNMGEVSRDRIGVETDLRRGIERGELELFYQPKVGLRNGAIVGAEALIRWRHPQRGLVPPLQFIPLAEETGLIGAIGDWVIEEAMRHLKQWIAAGIPPTRIAVNLSARQFRDSALLDRIQEMLRASGVNPQWLELELTESMLMQRGEASVTALHALRDCGFSLAIDDFGTGYSSLSYLQRFPIDTLKIDRSFVKDLETSRDSRVLAETILMMARNLGKSVVAEGVETIGQADILQRAGCEIIQGFLYSRPLPVAEFVALLRLGKLSPKDLAA